MSLRFRIGAIRTQRQGRASSCRRRLRAAVSRVHRSRRFHGMQAPARRTQGKETGAPCAVQKNRHAADARLSAPRLERYEQTLAQRRCRKGGAGQNRSSSRAIGRTRVYVTRPTRTRSAERDAEGIWTMRCAGRPTARQAVRRGRDGPPGSGGRGRCGGVRRDVWRARQMRRRYAGSALPPCRRRRQHALGQALPGKPRRVALMRRQRECALDRVSEARLERR